MDFKWPAKLKDLFEVDDDNMNYPKPFSDPKLLMDNFSNLEDKNLTLIRQCQEQDEVLERKREQFVRMNSDNQEQKAKQEILLRATEDKIKKTDAEKEILEEKKSDTSKQMISEETYDLIAQRVGKIVKEMIPENKNNTKRTPVEQLLDLERQIDRFIFYFQIIQDAEEDIWPNYVATNELKKLPSRSMLKTIRATEKQKNQQFKMEQKKLLEEEMKRAKQKEKEQKVVIKGLKPQMKTHEKPKVAKRQENKKRLTQDEEMQQRYLGQILIPEKERGRV